MNKLDLYIEKIVSGCFKILMIGIFFATFFIDKNIKAKNPNSVKWDNAGYFMIAIALLIAVTYVTRHIKAVSEKQWKIIVVSVGILVAVFQLIVVHWIPIEMNADFKQVREAAIGLTEGRSLAEYSYFLTSPNNINITLILSLIYRVFHNWRMVIYVGSLLTNLSVILISLSVKKATQNKWSGIICLLLGEVLVAMTWRAFLPYTDNYGMIFVALMVWLYTSEIKDNIKLPLVVLVGIVGAFVKITILIVLLALGIYSFVLFIKRKEYKKLLLRTALAFLLMIIGISGIKVVQNLSRDYYQYEASSTSKGWTYMFMVGQNQTYYGVVNDQDKKLRNQLMKKYDAQELKEQFFQEALNRIKNRGLLGNIDFYMMKLNVAYNDGYFHNMRSFADEKVNKNRLYLFYIDKKSKTYALGASIMQILWDMILVLLILNTFIFSKKYKKELNVETFAQIAILGITLYLMLFEGRSKYLYMMLPVYLYYAGIITCRFMDFCNEVREKEILKVGKS